MTNTKMLREKISQSGYKIAFIASKCGISYQAFLDRMKGQVDFRMDEVRILSKLLELNSNEIDEIFFALDGDETSTKGGE